MAEDAKERKNAKLKRDQARITNALQTATIARLRRQGASYRVCSELSGLTISQVRTRIEEINEKARQRAMKDEYIENRFPRAGTDYELRMRALHMRQEGFTYQQIARHLQTNDVTAQRWVDQALRQIEALETFDTDLLRREAINRLNALSAPLWEAAENQDFKAISALMKIEERRSKLLGLDAPTLVDITDKAKARAEAEGLDPEAVQSEIAEILREGKYPSA